MAQEPNRIRGFFSKLGKVWALLGITLILLLILEGLAAIAVQVKLGASGQVDPRQKADSYQGADWVPDYYREFKQSRTVVWEPYVYWKRIPFKGKYINIDDNGLRFTKSRPDPVADIWVFGGSTVWGSGARDGHTIPSQLADTLFEKYDVNARVVNFGESGYVSTQEVIRLEQMLKGTPPPDLVIFLDGINDVYSAFLAGEAGIPQNESNRTKEFNLLSENRTSCLTCSYLGSLIGESNLAQVLRALRKRAGGGVKVKPAHKLDDKLAGQVVQKYADNVDHVLKLAKTYEFKALFFWQPVIWKKGALTEYEGKMARKREYAKDWHNKVYDRIDNSQFLRSLHEFTDISSVFLEEKRPIFLDYAHTSEQGNTIIAELMAEKIISSGALHKMKPDSPEEAVVAVND